MPFITGHRTIPFYDGASANAVGLMTFAIPAAISKLFHGYPAKLRSNSQIRGWIPTVLATEMQFNAYSTCIQSHHNFMSLMTRARRDYARQPYASRLIAASFFPLTKFPLTKRGENAIENRGGLAIIRGTKKWIAITALSSFEISGGNVKRDSFEFLRVLFDANYKKKVRKRKKRKGREGTHRH